ncbi:MAG: GFA family protein [Terrimicrobiaceae bacterium]
MPESPSTHFGRCLCGKISYRIESAPGPTSLCHCEDCRRASGAPSVAWTFFPSGTLQWTGKIPRTVLHADRERTFCPDCGTPLTFFDPKIPGQFEVTTCSLDHPEQHIPADHNWESDRIPWFDPLPHLPRYPENSPAPLG